MSFQDIINIVFLTLVFILLFIVIGMLTLYSKKRTGKMSVKTMIGFCSGEMIHELRSKYKYWGLGTLKSLQSIDLYIVEKKEKYSIEELINDSELIFKLGSFTGEVIRTKKHYKWNFQESEPYMVKGESTIFPFSKIRKCIVNGSIDSIHDYGKLL